MDRELAKELKIAGFPTKAVRTEGVTLTPHELQTHREDVESGYYRPTLSDLIGACGGRFSRLFVMKAIWFAESDRPELVARGDTPEEAVARLWLALSKLDSSNIRPAARAGAAASI